MDPKYGPIKVKTYSNSYKGRISLLSATLASDNSVYQQLALDIGPDKVKKAAREMGIKSKLNAYPSEVLGGLEDGVSPLEMANAYATIASGGWRNRPKAITRVTFADGRVSNWGKPARAKAFTRRRDVRGDEDPRAEHEERHRRRRADRLPRRRQDGHDGRQHRRLVRRLHAEPLDRGLGRLPGQRVPMNPPTTPISVAGGTYPATIWQKYMKVAKKGCGDFTKPEAAVPEQAVQGQVPAGAAASPRTRPRAAGRTRRDTDKKQGGSTATAAGRTTAAPHRRAARSRRSRGPGGPAATGPAGARAARPARAAGPRAGRRAGRPGAVRRARLIPSAPQRYPLPL